MKREKLQIKLSEIPTDGRSYRYSRESGELVPVLQDLIQSEKFEISFDIRPIGNVYEVRGSVQTSLPRVCSRCGWDIQIPIQRNIQELILPKAEEAKGDTHVKSGSLVDEEADLAVTFVSEGVLDAAEFVHEIVALLDPAYPDCGKSECENLKETQARMQALAQESANAISGKKANPFEMLKDLVPKN